MTVTLLRDLMGINSNSVLASFSGLKQGEDVPAPTFVTKFDHAIRELGGISPDMAKGFLVNALNTKTKDGLGDLISKHMLNNGTGETREEIMAAVTYD